jgi:hypothetical protein
MKWKRHAGPGWAKFVEIPALDLHGSSDWRIDERDRLVYRSAYWRELIIVPPGFVTDLASIPRIFRALIPQNGKHRLAAIVHDYLCREKVLDRRLADWIFLEAMEVLEVNWLQRRIMYYAVASLTTWLRIRGRGKARGDIHDEADTE